MFNLMCNAEFGMRNSEFRIPNSKLRISRPNQQALTDTPEGNR